MIRRLVAEALRHVARRVHPQSEPPRHPSALNAADSARLVRDLANTCSPEEAEQRKRWAREQVAAMKQPKRPSSGTRSAPESSLGPGPHRQAGSAAEFGGGASEPDPALHRVQNAVSEPLRASNGHPYNRGHEPTESAADHPELSDFGGLGRNCPDLEIGRNMTDPASREVWRRAEQTASEVCQWPDHKRAGINVAERRETPVETAARVRREGSVSMRELAKMPDANLKAAVEALRGPKR